MICRVIGLLGLLFLATGCTMPQASGSYSGPPRSRCLTQPQRSQDYASDRPLVYLFCVESP